MGEYRFGCHKELFQSGDPTQQKVLDQLAKDHDIAHQWEDEVGEMKTKESAVEVRMGVKVEEGQASIPRWENRRFISFQVLEGGLASSTPPQKPNPAA